MSRTKEQTFPPTLNEREQQIQSDYEWCLHDGGVRQQYGGQVVVVHQRKIWGAGRSHAAAWAAARRKRGCPSKDRIAIVVVPPARDGQES